MKNLFETLLPAKADNTIRGSKIPFYFFVLLTLIGTVRSCIHIFSPDGGAGSIAGMDLSAGANGIIFAFALWGAEQLIYALIQWVVILRYRSLVPLMWGIQFLETMGRKLIGFLKPVTFAHTPPGAIENYIYLGLALAMLALALWSSQRTAAKNNV
jgi:hypothetical protein